MGGPVCLAAVDGVGALFVPSVPLRLPVDGGGLLLRSTTADSDGPATAFTRRSAAVVGDVPGLEFVEVHRAELARVATGLARSRSVQAVVVCPAGVSPARTALALAVGGVLREQRQDGRPVVTCAVCPALGIGRSAIPHEVTVTVGNQEQQRIVWELLEWADVPRWRASLGRPAVHA